MKFLFQVGEGKDLRLIVGTVHIVDFKGLKIADDDPAGVLVVGQITSVAAGLTKGGQHTAVRLLVALPQINILSLLLNQDAGVCNITVNEADVVQLDGEFKGNIFFRLFNAVNLLQERQPECLRFLFFIARPFQSAANLAAAFNICHGLALHSLAVSIIPQTNGYEQE